MGNRSTLLVDDSSSAPPLLPKDLFVLSDRQLVILWDHHPVRAPEVQHAARSSSASTCSSKGFYHDSHQRVGEEETQESALAIRLHRLLPELAKLRFQLVPSSGIKEAAFWQATLMLLKERLVEYNAALSFDEDVVGDKEQVQEMPRKTQESNNQNKNKNNEVKAKTKIATVVKTTSNLSTTNGISKRSDDWIRQLQVKDAQIADLQEQLQELQQQYAEAIAKNKGTNKCHKGSWQMDKDAMEFLKYPEEVKESLRTEKQRRMQQVRDEMKFILDSDHVQDSNGKWSCCGATDYKTSCRK
jgi:hypothetical protein